MEYEAKCKAFKTHGLSHTRLYRIWHSMYCRCYYKSTNGYKNYGGKGIKVCEEWKHSQGFMKFYNWAIQNGYEENLTLDRINVNGNYEPNNCRWITVKEQCNNKTNNRIFEYNGVKYNLTQLCNKYNINIVTFSDRIKSGMSIEEALHKPIIKKRRIFIIYIK